MAREGERRSYWALEYINGQQFIGRCYNQWTRGAIDVGLLFDSASEADAALQALKQEARDRLEKTQQPRPYQFWWDIECGLTMVVEVHRLLVVVSNE